MRIHGTYLTPDLAVEYTARGTSLTEAALAMRCAQCFKPEERLARRAAIFASYTCTNGTGSEVTWVTCERSKGKSTCSSGLVVRSHPRWILCDIFLKKHRFNLPLLTCLSSKLQSAKRHSAQHSAYLFSVLDSSHTSTKLFVQL